MMHQYVELSNVYDEREAEEDELDHDIAERQLGARSSASASEATATGIISSKRTFTSRVVAATMTSSMITMTKARIVTPLFLATLSP